MLGRVALVVLASSSLGSIALLAQEPEPPAFPGGVEQVTVDVVVTEEGVPVRGLSREDIQVYEDGQLQTVVSFEAVHVPESPSRTPKPRPRIATNHDQEDTRGRTFVVFFDDSHLTAETARRAKGAVAEFLTRGVREGDRVTLVASSGAAWWSTRMEAGREELIELLQRLDGLYTADNSRERMTAYEAMRIFIRRDSDMAFRVQRRFEDFGVVLPSNNEPSQARNFATSIDPYLMQKAGDVYRQSHARHNITLDALERALESLNAAEGRKSLILVSEGFIYDPNLVREFRRVVRATRRANTAIYFVNAKGLEGMPALMTSQFGPPVNQKDIGFIFSEDFEVTQGADGLATESGGFVIQNTNDLAGAFERIAQENSSYYLLGYNPTNLARDGEFREITVKVPGRKGIEVRARKGYYAPSEQDVDAEPGVDQAFQEALDSPFEMAEIPLRMTHAVGGEVGIGIAKVTVTTEVDVGAVELEERDGRYVGGVEFVLVAAQRETGEYSRYDQKVEMKLLPETREKMLKDGLTVRRDFDLGPGHYKAKIAVRDMRSAAVGTVEHEFEVPALQGFRVSTPVISDTRREEGEVEGVPGEALPVARREFEQGADVYCQFEVFGAQRDESGLPRVVMGYVVRAADGALVTRAEPSLIQPTSIGHLMRQVRLDLAGARPGDYELVMGVSDMLAGTFVELTEPFSVVGAGTGGFEF